MDTCNAMFTLHTWYIILDIHQWLNENGAAWFVNINIDRTKEADFYKTRILVTDKHFLIFFLKVTLRISEMKVLNKFHSLNQYITVYYIYIISIYSHTLKLPQWQQECHQPGLQMFWPTWSHHLHSSTETRQHHGGAAPTTSPWNLYNNVNMKLICIKCLHNNECDT